MDQNMSITKESLKYVDELLQNPEKYQVKISEINEATIIDCGITLTLTFTYLRIFCDEPLVSYTQDPC